MTSDFFRFRSEARVRELMAEFLKGKGSPDLVNWVTLVFSSLVRCATIYVIHVCHSLCLPVVYYFFIWINAVLLFNAVKWSVFLYCVIKTKETDENVICGTLKSFLKQLSEPILTYALHKRFLEAVGKFGALLSKFSTCNCTKMFYVRNLSHCANSFLLRDT